MTDSDIDSDEEIRIMAAAQEASHAALRQEVVEDTLEVVGLDYLVKSGRSRQQQKGIIPNRQTRCKQGLRLGTCNNI